MLDLNLPKYSFNVKETEEGLRIFDRCRNKFVALTPEEWVRQNMVEYLIHSKNYPPARIGNEVTVVVNGMRKRSDTVIYDKQMRPRIIAEYKAPNVKITPKVFDQIANYNFVLNVDILIVSNGMEHFCCRMDGDAHYTFLREIPDCQSLNW